MPDYYDAWFETDIGRIILKFELALVLDLLKPVRDDNILDAGCGTGVFTREITSSCNNVVGMDISLPMLKKAQSKINTGFSAVKADMLNLPFSDEIFSKTVSVTAIEFIVDAKRALTEMARVTKPGGIIVAATLNSLSPWAEKRKSEARKHGGVFASAIFRSPYELSTMLEYESTFNTCIHFGDDVSFSTALETERSMKGRAPSKGAFVACAWKKP